jgi:hypothetical protein
VAELSINVTERAAEQIKAQLGKRSQSNVESGVRLGVKGGGCSGMSYVIEYCDQPRPRDKLFEVALLELRSHAPGERRTLPRVQQGPAAARGRNLTRQVRLSRVRSRLRSRSAQAGAAVSRAVAEAASRSLRQGFAAGAQVFFRADDAAERRL